MVEMWKGADPQPPQDTGKTAALGVQGQIRKPSITWYNTNVKRVLGVAVGIQIGT